MREAEAIDSAPAVAGSQPASLVFGRDSRAGRAGGELHRREKGRLHLDPDWRLLACGSWGQAD